MDTTFFGRYFGVLVLIDSNSNNVISHYFVRTEKDIYYKLALNRLREKGYIIQSITCDGRRGLMKDLFNTPVQMCQFHMVAIVMRKLRKKHQSQAGKELKIIAKTLTQSSKNEFYRRLHSWFIKHQAFLKERSDKSNEKGYFPYKHRNVRSAYASLKRYMDFIFTYEKYSELNIEKTANRLEGLFSEQRIANIKKINISNYFVYYTFLITNFRRLHLRRCCHHRIHRYSRLRRSRRQIHLSHHQSHRDVE